MSSLKQKRNRGVMLTAKGLEKIQAARSNWECQENFGERSTYENISELTNLDINTIKKILAGKGKVDKRSLEKFYLAFKLKLDEESYTKFNPKIRENWGESVSINHFFGRTTELETLTSWLVSDRCRLIAIQGMGGIGKTTLSLKLAQQIKGQFDCIIWKSLRDAIPATEILAELIEFLSEGEETEVNLPKRIGARITRLISYLRSQRCLILLDNAESLLDHDVRAGKYRQEYQEYSELLTRVGASDHHSCLILTTREKPQEIAALEGETLPVRSLKLAGLKAEGHEIFKLKGLNASESELNALSDRLGGNPLALKVVSTTIQDLFDGNVAEFLQQEKAIFGDIYDLLDQQFNRLSNLEQEIMYWLASDREPVSIKELQADLVFHLPAIKILEALESLSRRSLIEKNGASFTQQPVVMEYVTSHLIETSCAEIVSQNPQLLQNHALIKATTKDYVRENQNRLILQPLINQLLTVFNDKQELEINLKQILANLPRKFSLHKGYTAGNIINLLSQMETDLTGYDFSNLCVWQADLRQTQLHQVNFQNADLSKSVFAENFGGIWSVAFSPDGQYLAAGDTKGDIILRRVTDGKPILRFTGHKGWVVSLAFSPDGNILASGSCDCTAKLWDVNTGKCLHSLEAHQHEVWSVAFSPDGNILASGCDDHQARLWDVNTGKCLQVFQGHTNAVLSVVFSLDGSKLITGSHDRTIKLWDLKTSKCQKVFQGHEDGVRAVSLSPCGQILASSSNDRTIRLWQLETGKCLQVLQGHANVVLCVAFFPQGGLLASSSIGHKVRLWDLKTGECLKVFHGHSNMINSIAFNPQGNIIASGSYDQSVKLWDMATYQCVKTWQGYSNQALSVAFSPDGLYTNRNKTLASGGQDQKIRLWDLTTGKIVKTLKGHTNWVFSVAFSPQHNILASGSGDKTIKVWDLHSGRLVNTLLGHQAAVRSIAFSPNGQTLASAGDDRTIKLWDLQTNQALQTLQEHKAEIWSIAFSADGKTLASGSFDSTVKLWDVNTGKCLKTFDEHKGWVWSVAFSSNNKTLASTSVDQTLRFWNVETGECQIIVQEDLGHSQLICFSKNSQILASCNGKHHIRLWNANNGKHLKNLQGHKALVNSIAFSPDSSTLISSSEDETIKIWDVQSGQCSKTLKATNPYEKMNIQGITGITKLTIETLKILGASRNIDID